VDQGIRNRHRRGVVFWHGRVAVRAVQHQRFTDIAIGDHFFQGAIARIVRAHKANLHQAFTRLNLCIHYPAAALGAHRQRLLTEDRFTGGNCR